MNMSVDLRIEQLRLRSAALDMTAEQFRSLGHGLVDRIAGFLTSISKHPVTRAGSPLEVREALDAACTLPEEGKDPGALLQHACDLLFAHSLFNGHPRFYGYITSSAAPIGMLADLLAAAVNANTGAWKLAPMASEIEASRQGSDSLPLLNRIESRLAFFGNFSKQAGQISC